jgi:hypothetical protein
VPFLAILIIAALTMVQLRLQGRLWWCVCHQAFIWVGDAWSSHTSQHLFDPYSFTHVLHGFMFFWLISLALPKLADHWQLVLTVALEGMWEIIENSEFVIQRYRETTAALGYSGDSILNSLSDMLLCGVGLVLARKLRWPRSVMVFAAVELVILFWIHDSLVLNIIMLIYPNASLKAWQSAH